MIKVLIIALLSKCVLSQYQFVIGGLFYEGSEEMEEALRVSADMLNFTTAIAKVSKKGVILEAGDSVCELAEKGIIGIVDGTSGRTSAHVQAICDILDVPHVLIDHNDLVQEDWLHLNLNPSPEAYNKVLTQLVELKEWTNFTIMYEKGYSLIRVANLLEMANKSLTVTVRELSGPNYRDVLINAKEHGYVNFIVDCPSNKLEQFLIHAQQVGLMADEHSYIFLSPDLFSLDLTPYRYGGVNVTGFRLLNTEDPKHLEEFLQRMAKNDTEDDIQPMGTKMFLIHDAVKVISEARMKIKDMKEGSSASCNNFQSWEYGSSLLNLMKTNQIEGITRDLKFDGMGQRSDLTMDVLELTSSGSQVVYLWKSNELTNIRQYLPPTDIAEESIMKNRTFKVLITETTHPFTYLKESASVLVGNDRYEGFAIDLIAKLSDMLGFSYVFENEYATGSYKNGVMNGMVEQIANQKADFGICDFTITTERQQAIDFSIPFMSTGIGILYREPSKQPPEMFSFMAVFAPEVWYNMVMIQLGLGVIMIVVGRLSHKEWQNPVPCIEEPEELSNQFSFANSVWLIIGSVMQQGSEIAPIALAPRMITSIWWFFTMIMVASYVGTLVAFLTVEKNVYPFNNVKELAGQNSISYGAKKEGSTLAFFRLWSREDKWRVFVCLSCEFIDLLALKLESIVSTEMMGIGYRLCGIQSTENFSRKDQPKGTMFNNMYHNMENNQWNLKDNEALIEEAKHSNFACFMESTFIEYYIEIHCELIQVGDLLDSKSYGIGMMKNSPYKKPIDDALLKLKESGVIKELKDLWWKEKRGGGKCGQVAEEDNKPLSMTNMTGVFVVLGAGCLVGIVISVLDMMWGVFKRSAKYQTTFKYELIKELKFALKFSGDVKPVKRPPKTDDSADALAEEEAKDEVKSLRSLSVRSTDTRRTCRSHKSHGSRHSSSSLSVAFARRRKYS